MQGIKHLIQCKCILPQFKTQQIFHKFVVFSIIDNDKVEKKLVQCNNCAAVHKVTEICKSEIINKKDNLRGVMSIDDYKINLPNNVSSLLESLNCQLHVWEEINFVIKHKKWGSKIIITHEAYDDYTCGKYIIINSKNDFEIETFDEENVITD